MWDATKKTMKYILLLAVVLSSCGNAKTERTAEETAVNQEIAWLYDWLAAWELVSGDVFGLEEASLPEMLFFDSAYVYTNAPVSAPQGRAIDGPTLYGKDIAWLKQSHNDTITIPNGSRAPIQIMTFAAPAEGQGTESFFVMAAPSFWKNAGIDSEEVGLQNMLTGVFLHEFAHTRQMDGIGAKLTGYEKNHTFDFPVSDDIIQDYFSDDSAYVRLFREETEAIYRLSNKPREEIKSSAVQTTLQALAARQEKYLKPEKDILVEMDRIFLTMEGVGQYAMVSWLTHPKGGGFSEETAIKATRRSKNWWSQDEGLALILLYKQVAQDPDWKVMFSKNPIDIIALIEKEINTERP